MLVFPASPSTGDIFMGWTWDGTKWAPTPIADYLPISGGTLRRHDGSSSIPGFVAGDGTLAAASLYAWSNDPLPIVSYSNTRPGVQMNLTASVGGPITKTWEIGFHAATPYQITITASNTGLGIAINDGGGVTVGSLVASSQIRAPTAYFPNGLFALHGLNVGLSEGVVTNVSDPLAIFSSGNARIQYNIPGLSTWTAGLQTDANFVIVNMVGNVPFIFQAHGVFYGAHIIAQAGLYSPGGIVIDTSDARIKHVRDEYHGGLDQIEQLKPVVFTYRGNEYEKPPTRPEGQQVPREETTAPYPSSPHYYVARDQTEFIGLIAQDVEHALPEIVKKAEGYIDGTHVNDLRSVQVTTLIFTLINAVKELSARGQQLEARVQELEGRRA